jgi:hypothetical protein
LRLRTKIILGFLILIILSSLYIGRFFFPMPLGQTESHLYERMRGFYNSVLYKYVYDPSFDNRDIHSPVPLDIVIPIVEKDIESAEHVVNSVRAFVMHPLGKIYFVAPESQRIRDLAHRMGVIFVHEDTAIPSFKNGFHKRGWIKQQYIKLNADSFVENDHYLVVDADTVFVRPHVFVLKGKTYFNVLRGYTQDRKYFTQEAVGTKKFYNLDFTAHHMVFEKEKLKIMKKHIEEKHKKSWADALNEISTPDAWFSEYELYANFFFEMFSQEGRIVHGRNIAIERKRLPYMHLLGPVAASYAKTVSMHV